MSDREASELEAAVSAVAGVSRLYPAGRAVARAAAAVGAVIGRDTRPCIAIAADGISIRIGVTPARAAADVCRDAYAVARDWAEANGMPGVPVEVTVAAIE